MSALRLGIDIGGTKTNIGLVDEKGIVVDHMKCFVDKTLSPSSAIQKISEISRQFLEKHRLDFQQVLSIGVGLPGTVDCRSGFLYKAPNLHWENISCGDLFYEHTGRKVFFTQDSRASAWGEYLFGSAKGVDVLMSVTLGTGIGCGIVINGSIFSGGLNAAGEVGHINAVPQGRLCPCGQKGCCEAYASGTGIKALAQDVPSLKGLPSEEVFALALQHHQDALNLIEKVISYLGYTLSAVANVLSPNAMIFSGGLSEQKSLFVQPLIQCIRNHTYPITAKEMVIRSSTLGSLAPLIGAAMLDKAFT